MSEPKTAIYPRQHARNSESVSYAAIARTQQFPRMLVDSLLTEAASQIQQLLHQLEQRYPTHTSLEKQVVIAEALKHIESHATLRQLIFSAQEAGSLDAFRLLVRHPLINILITALAIHHRTYDLLNIPFPSTQSVRSCTSPKRNVFSNRSAMMTTHHPPSISTIVQHALEIGYLTITAEKQLRQLLRSTYSKEDLDAFMTLQKAAMTGRVKQQSREVT